MIRSGCYQLERWGLGGICTRRNEVPFHGARGSRVNAEVILPSVHVASTADRL